VAYKGSMCLSLPKLQPCLKKSNEGTRKKEEKGNKPVRGSHTKRAFLSMKGRSEGIEYPMGATYDDQTFNFRKPSRRSA
jgi:hypothetical protein